MGKRQINVKEAVEDIRSGLDDRSLMVKYRLDAKGLQSLLDKLADVGAIERGELESRMTGYTATAVVSDDFTHSGEHTVSQLSVKESTKQKGVQTIKAREAVNAIRSGMTDTEIMAKYKLSAKGLRCLFDQLMQAGAVRQNDVERRTPLMDSTVDLRGVLGQMTLDEALSDGQSEEESAWKCPSCGRAHAGDPSVCPSCGYRISAGPEPARNIQENVQQVVMVAAPAAATPDEEDEEDVPGPSRTVKSDELVRDIRKGLTDDELMRKYKLNGKRLQRAFSKLLGNKMITEGELYSRASFFPETFAMEIGDVEHPEGRYVAVPLPIYEPKNPTLLGRVRDISESVVNVVGIDAAVDETKTLIILPERFIDMDPVILDVRCRWNKRTEAGDRITGFEITNIPKESLRRLKKLIDMLTFGG
jgi:rubrerythrin